MTSFDQAMMQIAIAMARRGLGSTAPNPAVGAVIVDEARGEVIARGWTQPGGRPHAETEAIRRAGPRACGATIYVTLEPCAHFGKTPPCTNAIIEAGLRRVVVGVLDPDPRTAGGGVRRLEEAGLEVVGGVLHDEARWVSLGHILRVAEKRPFIELKMALASDGEVARGRDGKPQWVTGPEARASGHLMRARADAILVGAETVRDDDPELTCRLPGLAWRSPIRVVLSRSLDVPLGAKLVTGSVAHPTWIMAPQTAPAARRSALEQAGVRVFALPQGPAGCDLGALLVTLAAEGVTRVLVEGGPAVWREFALAGVVDQISMFVACSEGDPLALSRRYAPGVDLSLVKRSTIGGDSLYVLRRA